MSSFKILKRVPPGKLGRVVPPAYRGLVSPASGEGAPLTVILFRHDTGSIITSATVEKAMKRLDDVTGRVIAVGGNFTVEAAGILRGRSGEILSLRDFVWTDESYEKIRVSIGARVKRPMN